MEPEVLDSLLQSYQAQQLVMLDSLNAMSGQLASTQANLDSLQVSVAANSSGSSESFFTTSNVWMLVSTFLVFIMHLGFATLEAGLIRAKNTTNILFKNTLIPCVSLLTYALCGFGLMYPDFSDSTNMVFDFAGWGIPLPEGGETSAYADGYTYWTDFLFQGMFAATAATIVSGAVAERVKLISFLIFTVLFVTVAYPIIGSWTWGGGWLATNIGFKDFAGSTLVHSVGGWGALAGAILLGPRIGKFVNGQIKPIPGHNMTLVVIGAMLLWLGWFGFNGGSVLDASPGNISRVLVTTCLAAAAGGFAASMTIFAISRLFDLSMTCNGILAGLVAITAGADVMSPGDSVIIGIIAGILVVLSVLMFERLRLDDPVGACSVHLVNGIWGTLAVGLLGDMASGDQVVAQLIGIGASGLAAFAFAFIVFILLKVTIGIRVEREIEQAGLDIPEHGASCYSFVTK